MIEVDALGGYPVAYQESNAVHSNQETDMQRATEEAEPDDKMMTGYLLCVISALVARAGGEVTITPRELYRASRTDTVWEREGNNYAIRNVDLCPL